MNNIILKLLIFIFNLIYIQGSNLFPYKNREIGLIPVSLTNEDIYVRIWEEYIQENSNKFTESCLNIGIDLDCRDLNCDIHENNKSNVYNICNYELYRQNEKRIPTFIDNDLPLCKIFNLKNILGIRELIQNYSNKLTICMCSKSSPQNLISPEVRMDIKGGWKFEIIDNIEVPKIYPSNRYIIDARILMNPGWNFDFTLVNSIKSKLNNYSIVSFKKDINCQGFPEEESLQILQPINIFPNNKFIYQIYSWRYDRNKEFTYKYPVNQQTTTHYYLCYYHHYNSNSGYNLGNIYFRLDPEDAIQTFSLFLLTIICAPLIIFIIYIIISTRHKKSIEKLQSILLFENRNHVS